jgi:segregation and condensation protein B
MTNQQQMNKPDEQAETGHVQEVLEGLLFVSGDEGLKVQQAAEIVGLPVDDVHRILEEMKSRFKRDGRGIQIIEIAGYNQLTTLPEHAPYFEKMAQTPSHATLSRAALETLAIIAYKQPITRAEVEEVRGVKSEKAIHTLSNKSLICEVGRKEGTGRAILYGTTNAFLEYFGLRDLDELPPVSDSVDVDEVRQEADFLFASDPE